MIRGCDNSMCAGRGTIGNVPVNRVSIDKIWAKTGTRKDTVLDDVGIRIKVGF